MSDTFDQTINVGEVIVTQRGNQAALKITALGSAPNSTSVGGTVNVDVSASTGAGLVVFSSQAAPTGRLIVGRASSATFGQSVAYFENAGTGHALHANQTNVNNATGSAANFTSTNVGNSCVFISGVETGRGSLKVTHTGTGTDANASCISLDIAGSGTAAQGIFIDATGGGTTGDLCDWRNNGNQLFKFRGVGLTRPEMQLGNGGPIWTYIPSGTPEGSVAAPPGSVCTVLTGGVGTTLYTKRAGTGNTGWFAVA